VQYGEQGRFGRQLPLQLDSSGCCQSRGVRPAQQPLATGSMLDQAGYRDIVLQRDEYRCRECGVACRREDADVHHLIPRSLGGSDDPSNLVTLCDGCHAAFHPNLQVKLSRRILETWALRLVRWLDHTGKVAEQAGNLGPALRLFGLERFRDGQLPVVLAALAGRSVLMVSPTGSGKSLCFQLPTVLRPGTAYVISPLKALMSDQVSDLQRKKLPGTFINSDLDREEKALRYTLLEKKAFKFLYLAPERFSVRDQSEIARLTRMRPNFLVVDEAHCIDRWGDDFRPDYGRLAEVRETVGRPPILAFTASAGVESQKRILESLGVPEAEVIVLGVDRPNIGLMRLPVERDDRARVISTLLNLRPPGKTMIFVPSIRIGTELQEKLRALGHSLPFYHGKIHPPHKRESLLKQFTGEQQPEVSEIICTNAFGMGLDVPNVRLVVHYQHPASVEDYLQEFGRAGRDNKPSLAILLAGKDDRGLPNFMARKTVEAAKRSPADVAQLLTVKLASIDKIHLMARPRSRCLRQSLLGYFEGTTGRKRTSLVMKIIAWLYSSQSKVRRLSYCCDYCDKTSLTNFELAALKVLRASP
jgi:ATP-dependent DNA helicase RecQ